MKKVELTTGIVVGMALLVSACGTNTEDTANDSAGTSTEETTIDESAEDVESTDDGAPTEDTEPTEDAGPTEDTADAGRELVGEPGEQFPEITRVDAEFLNDGTWTFDVTVSSPYDSPDRYADGWRVLDEEGNELGFRELAHDHANEQPFTRSLSGVEVPEGVTKVQIEGRDLVNGWSGETFLYSLPGGSSY